MLLKILVSKADRVIPSITFIEALRKSPKVWGGTNYKSSYPSLLSHLIAQKSDFMEGDYSTGFFSKGNKTYFLAFPPSLHGSRKDLVGYHRKQAFNRLIVIGRGSLDNTQGQILKI